MLEWKKTETDDTDAKVLFNICKYKTCFVQKIARIAKTVQCHSLLSGINDCREFRISIVRNVISVSYVTSH